MVLSTLMYPRFVTENEHVKAGLTWPGIVWAFHSVYTENSQPLTWLSHMLDCQLYGLNAGAHHLTNLSLPRCQFAAVSVAGPAHPRPLAQRVCRGVLRVGIRSMWNPSPGCANAKTFLSTFFWMLALLAYTRYARKPGVGPYLLVLACFGWD